MSTLSRRIAGATVASLGGLLLAAVAAPVAAQAATPCGTRIVTATSTTLNVFYFNCSGATVKRKIIIRFGKDSPCLAIAPQTDRLMVQYSIFSGGYQKTENC
jgi:ABC-type glycerol-3-phosphate transport system substrate-binding protein